MSSGSTLGTWLLVGLIGLGVYPCAKPEPAGDNAPPTHPIAATTGGGGDRAADIASDGLAGTTYADQGAPYGCTEDGSGHDAGYEWAQDNDVTDPDDCGGDSAAFEEGCRAYGEAYEEGRAAALEDGEEGAE